MTKQDSSAPLYLQVKNHIQRQIEEGRYADGDKLPSERQLCEQFSVSRIPVRKALEMLEAEDLIRSFQGKGSFVNAPKMRSNFVRIQTFAETLAQQGYSGYTKIVGFDERCTEHENASRLRLLGFADGEPVVFYDCSIQKPLANRFYQAAKEAEAADKAFSTFDLYSVAMTAIGKMDQKIIAVNADETLSKLLRIAVGTAVLVLETVIYNSRMEAVEHKRGYYRTDKYSFNLHRSI